MKTRLFLKDEVDSNRLLANIEEGVVIVLIKSGSEGSNYVASLIKGYVSFLSYEGKNLGHKKLAEIMAGKVDGIYEQSVKVSGKILTLHPKYWLDYGDGTKAKVNEFSSSLLNDQRVQYLAADNRGAYEVIVENRKLVYNQSKKFLDTPTGSDFIFVLSPSYELYVGEKKKGEFHHSSFLAGGAVIAAGTLVAHNGILKKITRQSGHYRPTPKSSDKFQQFLRKKKINLSEVEVDCYHC